jgi:hypothetical protein
VQAVLSLPASCSVIERSRLDYGRFPDPPVVIQGNNWATNKSSRGAKIHMSRQAVQVRDDRVRYTEDLGLIRAKSGTHNCTMQFLIEPGIEDLRLDIDISSPAFSGVLSVTADCPVKRMTKTTFSQR